MTEFDPEHIESLTSPPVVGRWYVVPCLVPEEGMILPIIGPRHADPDHGINATFEHHHADVRFMDDARLRAIVSLRAFSDGPEAGLDALTAPTALLAEVTMGNLVHRYPESVPVVFLARQCQREIPEGRVTPPWQKELEAAYAGRYLNPGGLCPHRGAPLLSLPRRGGRRVCPLHGLCFDEKGRQCPKDRR